MPWSPGPLLLGIGYRITSTSANVSAPGSEVPRHAHIGRETILILEGRQSDDAGIYETGTLVVNEPGTEHKVRSDTGCTALLIWERAPRLYEGT